MNCKFCGAEAVKIVEWLDGHSYDFSCGSEQTPHGFVRTEECYEAEIARKDVWIDRALKFIKGTAGAYYKSDRKYFCNFCSTRKNKGHLPTCPVGQAQALLADMEAGPSKSNIVAVRKEALEDILWWVEQVREDYEDAATGPPLKKEGDWDPTTLMWPQFYEELKQALAKMGAGNEGKA